MLRFGPSRAAGTVALVLVAAAPAAAEGRFAPWRPDPPLPPCTCRAQGRTFEIGETACLRTPEGSRIARCVMVINVPSWQPTATPCPQASLRRTPPG
ncbi:hypothetical protein SLNSH_21975 [Alsobacter soli]|uniref:DUF333 domain-containing protein n=1 Tax=Alsobacter soli TaxID=2109933 RepID=A0A2T1HML0_9HYPH|nr:hypothetical protein [Alsobacter soli]PSC02866.1 hypothetical protein SLNSH_21975 [Alsobacter soli]